MDEQESRIDEFLDAQSTQLSEILASRASDYLMASRKVLGSEKASSESVAKDQRLDRETLDRWLKHLQKTPREHPFLNDWDSLVNEMRLGKS